MSRIYPDDIFAKFGGPVRCFDKAGNQVEGVRWVDSDEGTFATMVNDGDGSWAIDWEKQEPIEVVRYGHLRLEKIKRDVTYTTSASNT